MGAALGEIESWRGVIEDINQEGEITVIHAKAPVAEMFGFASAIRSATQGRALWSTENSGFEAVPPNLQPEVVRAIRDRKSTRLNSSHSQISYAVFCLKKKKYTYHA